MSLPLPRRCLASLFVLGGLLSGPYSRADFELKDGDRVVLLGNALVEQEQRYGYWEAALVARFPGKKIVVRNLGWSGDTVFGPSRAGFGSVADGFRQLKEHTLSLNPTVLVIGYGGVESFDGPRGLPGFVKGYNALLDALAPAKARLVLLSPLRQENLGPPLPDPAANNANLRRYSDAVRNVAKKRGAAFVDLYDHLSGAVRTAPLTEDGIHPTAWGYWRSAFALAEGLGFAREPVDKVILDKWTKPSGAVVASPEGESWADLVNSAHRLPPPPAPEFGRPDPALELADRPFAPRKLAFGHLPEGVYVLSSEGRRLARADAAKWDDGVPLPAGPDADQAEKLRRLIVAKNELYFHRWRPQNETYLFGFRKAEQGRNAREIPQFDPLVAVKEAEIAKLAVPVGRKYRLERVEK